MNEELATGAENGIVLNKCYGGGKISKLAAAWLIRYDKNKSRAAKLRQQVDDDERGLYLDHFGYERTDPLLVTMVLKLGEAASDHSSLLVVEDVPCKKWEITEYDGIEDLRCIPCIDKPTRRAILDCIPFTKMDDVKEVLGQLVPCEDEGGGEVNKYFLDITPPGERHDEEQKPPFDDASVYQSTQVTVKDLLNRKKH